VVNRYNELEQENIGLRKKLGLEVEKDIEDKDAKKE
jgi:hypothetical protein